jgi:hypothetical protein
MVHRRTVDCRLIGRAGGPRQRAEQAYKGTWHTSGHSSSLSFLSLSHSSWAVPNPSHLPPPILLHPSPSLVFPAMFGLCKILLLALALSTAQAAPIHTKRIAQVISASTQKWEAACVRMFNNQRGAIFRSDSTLYSVPQEAEGNATLSP